MSSPDISVSTSGLEVAVIVERGRGGYILLLRADAAADVAGKRCDTSPCSTGCSVMLVLKWADEDEEEDVNVEEDDMDMPCLKGDDTCAIVVPEDALLPVPSRIEDSVALFLCIDFLECILSKLIGAASADGSPLAEMPSPEMPRETVRGVSSSALDNACISLRTGPILSVPLTP